MSKAGGVAHAEGIIFIVQAGGGQQVLEALTTASSKGMSWQRIGDILGHVPKQPSDATAPPWNRSA